MYSAAKSHQEAHLYVTMVPIEAVSLSYGRDLLHASKNDHDIHLRRALSNNIHGNMYKCPNAYTTHNTRYSTSRRSTGNVIHILCSSDGKMYFCTVSYTGYRAHQGEVGEIMRFPGEVVISGQTGNSLKYRM